MIDIHEAAFETTNIAYHEFLLFYKIGKPVVYGFVEGREDPSFYRSVIDNMLPTNWEVKLIRAGGKRKVLKLLAGMDWGRFSKKQVCFFVDRDLSDFLAEDKHAVQNLYVTDSYSIEYEVATVAMVMRTLEEILGVTDIASPEIEKIQRTYKSNLDVFIEAMACVMAQILIWRRSGASACLNNIEPKELFIFIDGKLSLKSQFVSQADRIRYASSRARVPFSTEGEIQAAEQELRIKDGLRKYTRGKYLIWFFIQCAKEIHQQISKFTAKYKAPPKARVELGFQNAMAILGPRARCPQSLKKFIEVSFLEHVRQSTAGN